MIRNIITAAALLAASAALASAATVTTFTDLSTTTTTDGVTCTVSGTTATITATTSTDLFVSSNTGSTTSASNYPYYSTTVTVVLDYSTVLSAATAITDSSDIVALVTISTGSSTATDIGIGLYNGSIVWTYGGAYYDSTNVFSLSDTTVTSAVDENGYLTVTVVANEYYTSSSHYSRMYLSDGTSYSSCYGLVSGSTVYTEIELNTEYVLGVTVTAGTDETNIASTSTTLAAAVAAAAVPEPSTFGLLAGIGALALVAARRRRR